MRIMCNNLTRNVLMTVQN